MITGPATKYTALASSSNARLTAQLPWLAEGSRSTKRIGVPRYAGFHAEVSAQPALDRSLESERAAAEAEERRHSLVNDDRERHVPDEVGIDRVGAKDALVGAGAEPCPEETAGQQSMAVVVTTLISRNMMFMTPY